MARKATDLKQERTFVIVKPDGVKRGLVGEIIHRFEQRGLKIIALKMVEPSHAMIKKHYPSNQAWLKRVGEKTEETYSQYGFDVGKELGTRDHIKIGYMVLDWTFTYMTSGPVVAMIVEGVHAISMVRKLVGTTYPNTSEAGTIRGDYSVDSPILANTNKRSVRNLVHASGDEAEAANEIKLWFKPTEVHDYKRVEEDLMF